MSVYVWVCLWVYIYVCVCVHIILEILYAFLKNKTIFHLNILVYVQFIELQKRVIDDAFKMIIIKENAFESLQIEVVLTYQPLLQWLFKVATFLEKKET